MNPEATLSKRETEIAELLAVGNSKKVIAYELYISERTVENTARNIYKKLEINTVAQLTIWWMCRKFNICLTMIKNPLVHAAMFLGITITTLFSDGEDKAIRVKSKVVYCKKAKRRNNDNDDLA